MKNLQINRYVDAIARTGSIRKASEQLSITPSALNRRILALEEELDIESLKVIDNLKDCTIKFTLNKLETTVIYGLDADLIVLCLNHLPVVHDIYLYLELYI